MVDNPKKKVLHRHGIHLYNLYSEEQVLKPTVVDKFLGRVHDGNIEVHSLFHEPMGKFSSKTIAEILGCHLASISQTLSQNKILKGFYFTRD